MKSAWNVLEFLKSKMIYVIYLYKQINFITET